MAALTKDRLGTFERMGDIFEAPQAASTTVYAGALVFKNASGYAEPATAALGKLPLGVAMEQSANAGANGAVNVKVKRGVFQFAAETGDEPTIAHKGQICYAADDQTVGMTPGVRSAAGIVVDVDTNGVWVDVGHLDVDSRKYVITLSDIDLDDEAAIRTYNIPVPVAGRVESIRTATYGATTAGADAVLTFSVNSDAITGGVVTIASSSATGTIDSATPTAANDVAVTDYIKMVITGAQTADSYANIAIVIAY